MANPLKLPFDFPPNAVPTTHQIQKNFEALLQFVQDLNDGVTALTNILVGNVTSTGVIKLANGTVAAPSLTFINSTTAGLYRIGSNNIGVTTDAAKGWEVDADGNIRQAQQPAFLVYMFTPQANFCGDGTDPTLIWTTEAYDTGGNFNLATGTFTAPVTGQYVFSGAISASGVGDSGTTNIGVVNIRTSNRDYEFTSNGQNGGGARITFSVLVDMDAGDTAYITFSTTAGEDNNLATADTEVAGNASLETFWSGTLIN